MSQSEVERFARDLETNAALRTEIANDGRLASIVAVATRHGYRFTVDEAADFARASGKELSDADLAGAAGGSAGGGGMFSPDPYTPPWPSVVPKVG